MDRAEKRLERAEKRLAEEKKQRKQAQKRKSTAFESWKNEKDPKFDAVLKANFDEAKHGLDEANKNVREAQASVRRAEDFVYQLLNASNGNDNGTLSRNMSLVLFP